MSTLAATAVSQLQARMARARDGQIARIVAAVDALPQRGEADTLIAPLRLRLAQLRPARPFGFTRLLWLPLDPVVLPAERWRPGDAGVPRRCLAPFAEAVRSALPDRGMALDAQARLLAPDDRTALVAAGAAVWPVAAAVLRRLPAGPGTREAGLAEAEIAPLATAMAAVLAEAAALEAMAATSCLATDEAIRAMLNRGAGQGGLALAMLTAVLLARLPVPAQLLVAAADGKPADRAMDHTLTRLQSDVAAGASLDGDPTEAALDAARVAAVLAGLEATASTERRRKLDQIRREADALCLGRFGRAATATLAQIGLLAVTGSDDGAVAALETAARDLRRLETAGRRLGSGERYDATLLAVSANLRSPDTALGLADRVRLVEMLCGPDEALALLAAPLG